MRIRPVLCLAVLAAFAAAPAVRAEEPAKPTLVVKLKSIEGLISDAKYFAKLAGKEEELKQADEMLKSFTNEQGLGGIDLKRTIGLYGTLTPGLQDSPVVLLLPIADEKAFIDFLGNFMIKPEKDKEGVYTVDNIPNLPVPVTVYFRFANKYAYVTAQEKGNIAKNKLPLPDKVLPNDDSVISVSARVGDLPDILKQIALGQLENILASAKEKKDENEPEAVTKFKAKAIDYVGSQIKALLTDGEEVTLRVAVDQKKDDITVDAAFKAKAGSKLAKDMEAAGKSQTLFGALTSKDDAVRVNGTVVFPDELKKLLGPAVDEMAKQVIEKEKDQVKMALAKAAMEKISPTLKAGELDGALSIRGPDSDGHYTVVGALKVKEGKGIESFLRDVVKNLPEGEKGKVMLDADSAGDAKIHKLTIDNMDADAKKAFGSTTAYLAVRDDALLLGLGADGLKAVKEATAAVAAGPGQPLTVVVSVARAAGLDKKQEDTAKSAKEVFGANPAGNDTVTVSAELTDTLKLKIQIKGKVIAFGAKTAGQAAAAPAAKDK